jgi:hypothetical protein
VENEMGEAEIRIVTGMKAPLIDEYLKIRRGIKLPSLLKEYWPNGTT